MTLKEFKIDTVLPPKDDSKFGLGKKTPGKAAADLLMNLQFGVEDSMSSISVED